MASCKPPQRKSTATVKRSRLRKPQARLCMVAIFEFMPLATALLTRCVKLVGTLAKWRWLSRAASIIGRQLCAWPRNTSAASTARPVLGQASSPVTRSSAAAFFTCVAGSTSMGCASNMVVKRDATRRATDARKTRARPVTNASNEIPALE